MCVLSIYLSIYLSCLFVCVYLSIYHSHRGLSDLLQLVRSRQVAESPLNNSVKLMSLSREGIFPRTSLSFNLKYLQEDIVSIYLSGRSIIKDVSSLRSVFKFRQEETNTQPSEYVTIHIFLTLLSINFSIHLQNNYPLSNYLSLCLYMYIYPHLSSPLGAASDLSSLKDQLPDSFRAPLCDDLTRHLEYEFHSANYHTLTDIVIGLRTALGHLIKVGVV